METAQFCPECRAVWHDEKTCQDYFHQMLAWEWEYPGYGEVHHLLVLCYHLQHPSLYSPAGLKYGIHLLKTFVEDGVTPQEVRRHGSTAMNSHERTWKVTGTPAAHGVYDPPVQWALTAAHVIENGAGTYRESVQAWARSMYEALKAAALISAE